MIEFLTKFTQLVTFCLFRYKLPLTKKKQKVMARFEYTKTIEHYSFSAPRYVSEEDYMIIKMKIKQNPSAPLIKESSVEDSHDRLSGVLIVGIIAFIFGLLGMLSSDNPPAWSIILLIASILGVIHPLINMGVYESSRNRNQAERQRIAYFRKLKELVKDSNDYSQFRMKYGRMYGGL